MFIVQGIVLVFVVFVEATLLSTDDDDDDDDDDATSVAMFFLT